MLRKIIEERLLRSSNIDSRWFQFATVDLEGNPSVRTVVFRGFESENTVAFSTDVRSDKVKHLRNNSNAEICWYFKEERSQIRIRTWCEIISTPAAKLKYWQDLSPYTRAQFLWPQDPQNGGDFPSELSLDDPRVKTGFDNFCVVFCHAIDINLLELSSQPAIPVRIKL
jgi:pyridoxamine 5'-phosphate oxidase